MEAAVLVTDRQKRIAEIAREIRHSQRRVGLEVLTIGQRLLEAKDLLFGGFGRWVEEQCGFSLRTAENMMAVASRLLERPETVSLLPASVLYQLAAPSTSETVIDTIATRIKQGEVMGPAEVERIIVSSRTHRARRTVSEVVSEAATNVVQEVLATGGHVAVNGETISAALTEQAAEAVRIDGEVLRHQIEREQGLAGVPCHRGKAVVDHVDRGGRVTFYAPELASVLKDRQRITYVIYVTAGDGLAMTLARA